MKKTLFYSAIAFCLSLFIQSCGSSPKTGALSSCENLPNIEFKNSQIGIDKEATLKLIADLAASAKNDASTSKVVDATAALNIKSEFGKKLKENVNASQSVSDDFWEQNVTITQLLCFTESQSKRTDLATNEKSRFVEILAQIILDRNTYLTERSKKKPSNP